MSVTNEDLIDSIITCHNQRSRSEGGTYHLDSEYEEIDREEMESWPRELLIAELNMAKSGEQFLGQAECTLVKPFPKAPPEGRFNWGEESDHE